jgi:threonine dehydrogenase-like Zn-dependent dehydrogenase
MGPPRCPFRRPHDPDPVIEPGIDCAGASAEIEYLMDHTRGVVILFAVQRGPVRSMERPPGHYRGLILRGYPDRDHASGEDAVRAIANGDIDLSPVVGHRMRLEEYDRSLELIGSQQALKVLFTFDERDW